MDYETLSSDKKQIILDLAIKAVFLCPGLAGNTAGGEQPEKISEFARTLAKSIHDPVLPS
jgi:hypothetical protein